MTNDDARKKWAAALAQLARDKRNRRGKRGRDPYAQWIERGARQPAGGINEGGGLSDRPR